jgi:glycosyltransferase involved in cell wall biosynthesis
MITYNHEKFIREAIESVLSQKTNFTFELVIADDCSKDNTRQICIAYQQKYPDKIKLLLPEKNLGMMANFINTLEACDRKYIALCEGDDYWTDVNKLQKQVDFLEQHQDFVMCFHNVVEFFAESSTKNFYYCPDNQKDTSTLTDLLIRNFIPTCSVVFRNKLIKNLPTWYYHLKMGDWTLHILNAQYGKIKYINEVMAVHRIHAGGVWSGKKHSENLKDIINTYDILDNHLDNQYHKTIQEYKFSYLNALYEEYYKQQEKILSIKVLLSQVAIWNGYAFKKEFFKKIIQILF